jgi:hypothetical protein
MDATQITYRNLQFETGVLLGPVLGADFIAGIEADSAVWKVVPLAQVAELSFASVMTAYARPMQNRDQTFGEHVHQLRGSFLNLTLVSNKQIRAELCEVRNQMAWFVSDSIPSAVPLSALASVVLWKTRMPQSVPVATFGEKEGLEDEDN